MSVAWLICQRHLLIHPQLASCNASHAGLLKDVFSCFTSDREVRPLDSASAGSYETGERHIASALSRCDSEQLVCLSASGSYQVLTYYFIGASAIALVLCSK